MNYGMLWFDNDPDADLPKKIDRAAAYYRKKYGLAPTICYVNPKMAEEKKAKAGEVEIKTSPTILPNHLWIGITKKEEKKLKSEK